MGSSLIDQMRKLRDLFWSKSDPIGRGFVPLAEVLRRLGELEEAERVLRDGLARHPDMASGHVVAGRVHLDREDPGDAETAFNRALELDPRNVEALRNLGRILKDKGDTTRSLELARRLLEEEPWNQGLSDELRVLESTLADSTAAETAGAADDGSGSIWGWLTEAEIQEGIDWDRATLQPDDSAGVEETSPAFAVEDGPTQEEAWILEEVPEPEVEPEDGSSLVTRTLGEIYLRQGLLGQARDVFSELRQRTPEDADIERRLQEIDSRLQAGGRGPVIPIHDLAPDAAVSEIVVPIELLAPDPDPAVGPHLAFEAWIDGPGGPAPVVSIQALAPDANTRADEESRGPSGPDGILDDFKDWLDNLP